MPSLRYTAIFEPGEHGGCHAFVPALTGCHSYGDTLEEARSSLREAIALYLEDLQAEGEPPPSEELVFDTVEVAA